MISALSRKFAHKTAIRFALGVLVPILFAAGCATRPAVVAKDENQVLRMRAMEYWDLMINVNPRNAEKLYYQYEAPIFRDRVSFPEYINRFKSVRYFEADVQEVNIEGEKAKVTVVATSEASLPMRPKKLKDTTVERWAKVGGTWYHFPREWSMPE